VAEPSRIGCVDASVDGASPNRKEAANGHLADTSITISCGASEEATEDVDLQVFQAH